MINSAKFSQCHLLGVCLGMSLLNLEVSTNVPLHPTQRAVQHSCMYSICVCVYCVCVCVCVYAAASLHSIMYIRYSQCISKCNVGGWVCACVCTYLSVLAS